MISVGFENTANKVEEDVAGKRQRSYCRSAAFSNAMGLSSSGLFLKKELSTKKCPGGGSCIEYAAKRNSTVSLRKRFEIKIS